MPNFVGAIIATGSFLSKTQYLEHTAAVCSQEKKAAGFPCPNMYAECLAFPWEAGSEKLRLSLGVFTLLPALRNKQSTPLVPRWVYLVFLPSLGEAREAKSQVK